MLMDSVERGYLVGVTLHYSSATTRRTVLRLAGLPKFHDDFTWGNDHLASMTCPKTGRQILPSEADTPGEEAASLSNSIAYTTSLFDKYIQEHSIV